MSSKKPANWSWAGPVALMVGLLLGQAVIYAATGWRDGWQDPDLWRLKHRCFRHLPWTLAAAALVGGLLERFHQRWLNPGPSHALGGWPVGVAILRVFLHFPFYGFFVLIQFAGILILGAARILWRRVGKLPAKPRPADFPFLDSVALWMLLGPFQGQADEEGQVLTFALSPSTLAARVPWFLLLIALGLWAWTGAESEASGERVNAFLLSLPAAVWVGDFLLLAWLNRPCWMWRPSPGSHP
jgi:hypothetical protein